MEPIFFGNTTALRKWFEKNHLKEKELMVGYYKTGAGKPTIAWSQSVDEAGLCRRAQAEAFELWEEGQ